MCFPYFNGPSSLVCLSPKSVEIAPFLNLVFVSLSLSCFTCWPPPLGRHTHRYNSNQSIESTLDQDGGVSSSSFRLVGHGRVRFLRDRVSIVCAHRVLSGPYRVGGQLLLSARFFFVLSPRNLHSAFDHLTSQLLFHPGCHLKWSAA